MKPVGRARGQVQKGEGRRERDKCASRDLVRDGYLVRTHSISVPTIEDAIVWYKTCIFGPVHTRHDPIFGTTDVLQSGVWELRAVARDTKGDGSSQLNPDP